MGIVQFISSKLSQTAVYWGSPQEDGYGGQTFADPIEIPCRWEDKVQILGTITGQQTIGYQNISRTVVYVDRDLDEEGYLWLGTLDGIEDNVNPKDVPRAWIIKRFEKSPALGSTTEFLRKAFLTPWLT